MSSYWIIKDFMIKHGQGSKMIAISNLQYQINDQIIINELNLEIDKGETFVILGPSGCGKSTLLRLIMGLIKPSAGSIFIEGQNTQYLTRQEWQKIRNKMNLVFQSAALFDSLTVFENVAFSLRPLELSEKTIQERVIQSLEIVGLAPDTMHKMPSGLSGGMKKRVAIARAIAIKPPILLYDEPTAGLDPMIADTINGLILDLQKKMGITSIVVTHDMISALTVANRIGLLYQGRLVEIRQRSEIAEAEHPLFQQFFKHYRL
jgi:phospholipid/cholesterol/gamma-HCH transport system ATP-binding protein